MSYEFRCDRCNYATDNEESLQQHQSMHQNQNSNNKGFTSRLKALGTRF